MNKQDQQIKNTQYQQNIQIINEGWGIMFGQARQQIITWWEKTRTTAHN